MSLFATALRPAADRALVVRHLPLVLAVLFAGLSLVLPEVCVPAATVISAICWGRAPHKLYVRNVVARRLLKPWPYFVPFARFGWIGSLGHVPIWALVALAGVVVAIHAWHWEDLRTLFRRDILSITPRESFTRRWTETYFFLIPALAQEYVYRGLLFRATPLPRGWFGIAVFACLSAVAFILEHVYMDRRGWAGATTKEIVDWTALSVVNAVVFAATQNLWLTIASHLAVNLPRAILPWLRRGDPFPSFSEQ